MIPKHNPEAKEKCKFTEPLKSSSKKAEKLTLFT
jgi:hypothetical protein